MRAILISILVLLVISSCNQFEGNKQGLIATDSSSKPKDFICNYPDYKLTSKKYFEPYKNDRDLSVKQRFLNYVRDTLFTCWLGTPWDFNGTAEEPGNGKIACGYFVTTLLRDMGVTINRIKHAQCASEEMILAVCLKKSIHRFSNENISTFVERINEPGLYIVGLDFHTGFILKDGSETYFIHANYTGDRIVEKEIAIKSTVLGGSKYKVIGKVI